MPKVKPLHKNIKEPLRTVEGPSNLPKLVLNSMQLRSLVSSVFPSGSCTDACTPAAVIGDRVLSAHSFSSILLECSAAWRPRAASYRRCKDLLQMPTQSRGSGRGEGARNPQHFTVIEKDCGRPDLASTCSFCLSYVALAFRELP